MIIGILHASEEDSSKIIKQGKQETVALIWVLVTIEREFVNFCSALLFHFESRVSQILQGVLGIKTWASSAPVLGQKSFCIIFLISLVKMWNVNCNEEIFNNISECFVQMEEQLEQISINTTYEKQTTQTSIISFTQASLKLQFHLHMALLKV